MIGKIAGALIGEKIAERYGQGGAKGALIGAFAPVVARRLLGPLGLAPWPGGGYVAKKYYDSRRAQGRGPAT